MPQTAILGRWSNTEGKYSRAIWQRRRFHRGLCYWEGLPYRGSPCVPPYWGQRTGIDARITTEIACLAIIKCSINCFLIIHFEKVDSSGFDRYLSTDRKQMNYHSSSFFRNAKWTTGTRCDIAANPSSIKSILCQDHWSLWGSLDTSIPILEDVWTGRRVYRLQTSEQRLDQACRIGAIILPHRHRIFWAQRFGRPCISTAHGMFGWILATRVRGCGPVETQCTLGGPLQRPTSGASRYELVNLWWYVM